MKQGVDRMKTVPTFTATIYVGFRERYTEIVRPIETAYDALQKLADNGGLCVTVTPLHFVYKNGREPGMAVGLINYPRFPEDAASLRTKSLNIAQILMHTFHQAKVSVVFPDETVMLESESA